MKCIGIIGAMEQEVAKIKEKMQDVTITSRASRKSSNITPKPPKLELQS